MAVTKRTRYEVLKRDNHACRYCGQMAPDVILTIDHVNPKALGGSDSPDNLVAACKDCNAGKTSIHPGAELVADVAQDAVRWAAAMKGATEIRATQRAARDEYVGVVDEKWLTYTYVCNGEHLERAPDWRHSVQRFYEVGLPLEEMVESVEIAATNQMVSGDQKWRYTCGVAWKKLSEIQEMAKSLAVLDDPEPVGAE